MSTSNPALPVIGRKRYARSWAWAITLRLTKAYPRASDIVLKNLAIDVEKLVRYLERGDEVYAQVRQLIHDCEHLMKKDDKVGTVSDYYDFLCQTASRRGYERIFLRLDSLKTMPED